MEKSVELDIRQSFESSRWDSQTDLCWVLFRAVVLNRLDVENECGSRHERAAYSAKSQSWLS